MSEAVALAAGAALAVLCVIFVARPFLREPTAADDALAEPRAAERERIRLEEERDRSLAALKELEFDHRTGKVSDKDYRELVGRLRREAADAVRAVDRVSLRGKGQGNEDTMNATKPSLAEARREPARVPEPWPPPDEGDLPGPPTPSPGEPTPGPEEPAPPRHPSVPQTRA